KTHLSAKEKRDEFKQLKITFSLLKDTIPIVMFLKFILKYPDILYLIIKK
mgnify:CR=1